MNDPKIRNTVLALFGVMILAAAFFLWVAAPSLGLQGLSRERQRVVADTDALRIAVETARELDGGVAACGSADEARARAIAGDTSWKETACWSRVGFHPKDPVIATFWLAPTADGFVVGAFADLDADGAPLEVRSAGATVQVVSPEGVN